jgi:chitodextrinase
MFSTDLSWTASTDNVGVTGYDVYLGASLIGTTAATLFNVTGLSPDTLYTFTVVAKDAAGNESVPSDPLNVTTMSDTIAPSAPTNLVALNTTQTTTDLSWDASTDNIGVTGYNIKEGTIVIGTTSATNFGVVGLLPSTSYSFTVVAFDAAGNESTSSNTVNVTTSDEPNGCLGGISNFPYAEGFEGSIGLWLQNAGDDLDWTVNAYGTPSNNTGPSSAIEGNSYIYVEASGDGTGYPNKNAIITSPCLDLSNESVAFFNFNYHMFGAADMGSIILEVSDDDGITWNSIWQQTGNQGNLWLGQSIDLSAYLGSAVKLRFNRTTGATWQADIAIDNIVLVNEISAGCSGGIALPYNESFEASIGSWSQSAADDINWTRDSGGTPSNNTGPSSGSNGSFYMYVEASGNGTGYPNKRAIFNSPCFDFSGINSATFNFDYHMFGSNDMGNIALEVSIDDAQNWVTIWNQTGNQGNQWNSVSLDVSSYTGGGAQFRFNRLTGGTWQADIAIDNIEVTGSMSASPITTTDPFDGSQTGYDFVPSFTLYPNPVKQGALYFSLNTTMKAYTVYNVSGQRLLSGGIGTEYIDVSSLPSAVYLIEFATDYGKVMGQFIVE